VHTWDLIHRWSSLVCTLFLFMLCITGLPLIFHHEIDDWLGRVVPPLHHPAALSAGNLDRVVAGARARFPDRPILFASHEQDDPLLWFVTLGAAPAADDPARQVHAPTLVQAAVDATDGRVVAEPAVGDTGLMATLLDLHVRLFAGLPGELFLGSMGLLCVVSIVSGIRLYSPFMRGLSFGDVRRHRGARIRWLDLHNLLGMATVAWLTVVVVSGAVNSFATPVLKYWQSHEVRALTADVATTAISRPEKLDLVVQQAQRIYPALSLQFIAFPGSSFSSPLHYGVYFQGSTEATSHLLRLVFVDARSGGVSASPRLPWYIDALLLAEPLHFGDFGGLPFKWAWAVLDLLSIVVLGSGLFLWVARTRRVHTRRSRIDVSRAH
jgi:uncharacterized iron-regulated membrane protein